MDVDPTPARPQASARAPIDLTAELSSAPVQPDGEQPAGNAKPLTRDMHDAVQQGLATGMTRVRRVRIILCGQFGTGKTSLMDSIKNEPFVPDKPSTLVLDVAPNNLFRRDGILAADPERTAMHLLGGEFRKLAKQLESQRLEAQKREEERKKPERAQQEDLRRQRQPAKPKSSDQEKLAREPAKRSNLDHAAKMTNTLPSTPTPSTQLPDIHAVPELTPASAIPPSPAKARGATPHDPTPSIDTVKLEKKLIDDILADVELMREIGDDEVIVSTWDCGGQSIFSNMQHFLMGEEYVIYILCFNAKERLQKVKPEVYTRLGKADESENKLIPIEVPENLKNIDHIRHWLTTIHLASMTSSKETPEKYPPVIMVGNFADQLDPSTSLPDHKRIIWKQLRELCYRSPTFNGMLGDTGPGGVSTRDQDSLFLVDNTKSGSSDKLSPQVEALCATLRRATSRILDGKKVEKRWLRFEWILKHLNSIKDRPGYTDRQSIARLAKTACDVRNDGDLEEMLLFYDRLRLIIYKPTEGSDRSTDDDIIIYNMSWLIGQINRLIFGPRFMDDGTANQRDDEDANEDPATADLRARLWEKGILVERLVCKAWTNSKPEVSNKMLDVMVAWNLLYEHTPDAATAGRRREFFVPSALRKKPDCSVMDALRERGDASDDELAFSTSDCPLLIMLQDGVDYYDPDPDTPLPHSYYCQLLVKLLKRWRIKITQKMKCSLAYNSARFRVPKRALELDGFQGHVELFVAHYDSSGAILVSLGFKQPTSGFEDGFLSLSDGKKASIASVCCRVRETIYEELQRLCDPKTPQLKMFAVPVQPTCDCELASWKDRRTGCSDLGYVPWKVMFGCSGSPGKFRGEDVDCEECGKESRACGNAHCWFDSTAGFTMCGKQNEPAKQKLANRSPKRTQPICWRAAPGLAPATRIPQEMLAFFIRNGLNVPSQAMPPMIRSSQQAASSTSSSSSAVAVADWRERARRACLFLHREGGFPVGFFDDAVRACDRLSDDEQLCEVLVQHFHQPVEYGGRIFWRCAWSRRDALLRIQQHRAAARVTPLFEIAAACVQSCRKGGTGTGQLVARVTDAVRRACPLPAPPTTRALPPITAQQGSRAQLRELPGAATPALPPPLAATVQQGSRAQLRESPVAATPALPPRPAVSSLNYTTSGDAGTAIGDESCRGDAGTAMQGDESCRGGPGKPMAAAGSDERGYPPLVSRTGSSRRAAVLGHLCSAQAIIVYVVLVALFAKFVWGQE